MRFGGFASRLSGAAVLVFAGVPVETTPAAPHIAHYETAQRVALRRADPSLPASRPTVGTTLEFHAFGRQFLLLLEPNERLVAPLRSSHRLPTGDRLPLRGRIAGHPSSWARFSIIGGRPSGVVWDGHELFLVDSAANLGDFLGETLPAHTIVAFRASDLRLTIDEVRHPDGAGKTMSGDQLLAETVRLAASSTLPQPGRAIPLGLILDAPFAGQGLENALFPTNIADGIHSSQLDLHLDVEHIEAFDYANDPFVSSDPGVLLQQVSSIKASYPHLRNWGLHTC